MNLALRYNKAEGSEFKSFSVIANTIRNNYKSIFNFFNNCNTNADTKSYNANLKALRRQFRGVISIPFFSFRLHRVYAQPTMFSS